MLHCFDAESALALPATFAPMPKTLTRAWPVAWDHCLAEIDRRFGQAAMGRLEEPPEGVPGPNH